MSNWSKDMKHICQRLLFRFIEIISNVFFWIVYHGSGEKMPPVENLLLLDTASALAHKIRNKKVSYILV